MYERLGRKNISRDFKLRNDVIRDQNDLASIESLIEQMSSSRVNPVIIHQQQDGGNHFILELCNEGQRFILKRFGRDTTAIDSTHGTNVYVFHLTIIMIVDENR